MRRQFTVCVPFLAALLAITLGHPASSDEDSGDVAQVRRWHTFYRERAAEFSVAEHHNDTVPLTLVPTPLQTWTNPIRGDTQHGTIHLWTNAGRPSVIGSVWSALDPKDRSQRALCYEFHSLTQVPVSATLGDKPWWSPREAGVEWLPLADTPKPGPSRTARLRNMRDLAAELQASIIGDDPQPDTDLRLLSQPLYRYPENTPGAVDGAIFAFVMATDPELFVLIELRRNESTGEASWTLAPARLTGSALRLRRGERTVWESPTWEYQRDRPYDFLYGVEKQPAVLTDESGSFPSGGPK
ncbi:hypothetical protein [Planctomyces sp. SH-PL14]|uniref:hypothetical protein n=1 Tax=Planctomyces sp. SH-PL14 TaxID=1632864 RepID=UPI00078D172B|nr:hypothetical protein [Planctomyces sp. SH-PL14]AMV20750.1 hypothetical protein VT03_22810 [Planctomyces sp. SH-PL14]